MRFAKTQETCPTLVTAEPISNLIESSPYNWAFSNSGCDWLTLRLSLFPPSTGALITSSSTDNNSMRDNRPPCIQVLLVHADKRGEKGEIARKSRLQKVTIEIGNLLIMLPSRTRCGWVKIVGKYPQMYS
ncbi:hypothetical protein CEXT_23091 [Caerostris extrusa]|uniref:Uncharacterized protein n=1 Tax=Caerostris extrusa TaxID=172846 RepID=A0AAV4N3J5_CAEEX|nr:hypothetical protein CEXT_23091 [Caerostris extrusa]